MEVVKESAEALNPAIAATDQTYSPAAVLHLFNISLVVSQTRRLITVRGIYQPGRGTNYNSFFYDSLRDEASDAAMTLVVPALLRGRLREGETILFQGFIARKVVPAGGRIELHIHMDSLLEKPQPLFSESDLRALEIQRQKAAAGYRDVEALLKARIIAGEAPRVVILVGKTAIIDADISHQLGESAASYDLHFHRVNLHSETAILAALQAYNSEEIDLLAISRGGGENLDIFDSCTLAEACLDLVPYFATAIGHKEDVTLLQRIADKAFITPTALGQYLNELYNETAEQLQNSKAALVESVTKQLSEQYEGQLRNLAQKAADAEGVHAERTLLLQRQLDDRARLLAAQQELAEELQSRLSSRSSAEKPVWLLVLIAALAGVVIGALLVKVLG